MKFEKVLNGILKYLNDEIYANMNDWQEIIARVAVARMIGDSNELKAKLMNNSYVKTFAIIDSSGDIDVDGILTDLKEQIAAKGKLTVSLPMFGNFTFFPDDVDKLYDAINKAN